MQIKFTKMHGIGNDYIYINCFDSETSESDIEPEALAKAMSPRHFSVGADGVVLMSDSDIADAKMRMFNSDGSEGAMCGNAIRCMARFLHDEGIVTKTFMTIETLSGIKKIKVCPRCDLISVEMGKADFTPANIPVITNKDIVQDEPIEINGQEYKITCVSMGNPHAVVYVEDVESLDLEKIGPEFENHPMFPDRVNTEFVQVIDDRTLKMRVWERGSGETFACGTGASAAVAASVLNNLCKLGEAITVQLIGGELIIICEDDWEVTMKGIAEKVFDGVYNYEKNPRKPNIFGS